MYIKNDGEGAIKGKTTGVISYIQYFLFLVAVNLISDGNNIGYNRKPAIIYIVFFVRRK